MSINFLTQQVSFANAHLLATYASTSLANNSNITPTTISVSNIDGIEWDATGNAATVKASGRYDLGVGLSIASPSASSSVSLEWRLNTNSSANRVAAVQLLAADNIRRQTANRIIYLNAGDILYPRIDSTSTAGTAGGIAGYSYFYIQRQSDYTHGSPVGFGLATAERAGLVPSMSKDVITLVNSGPSNMNGTFICTRIGSLVTISATGNVTHDSTSNAASAAGVIPAQYRPPAEAWNTYAALVENLNFVVETGGTVRLRYSTTSTGASVNRSNSGSIIPYISYNIL